MQPITSPQNERYKRIRSLCTGRKQREKETLFIQEGLRAIRSLLEADGRFSVEELWLDQNAATDPEVQTLCAALGAPVFTLPARLFKSLTDTVHPQGAAAVVRHHPLPFQLKPQRGRYLLLENIGDPGNLGTLIRGAAAAGIDGLFLHGTCTELYNPKTLRAAMGLLPFVPVWETPPDLFEQLTRLDYTLLATVVRGGESLFAARFPERTVLAIGSEAHGLSEDLLHRADGKISIPMQPACESLNAAMAGTLCLFQMTCGAAEC
jgi:TrmH family RNA methyltransferase